MRAPLYEELAKEAAPGFDAMDEVTKNVIRQNTRRVVMAFYNRFAEPTPAMLAALAREKKLFGNRLTISQAWRAMLEAGPDE